LTTRAGEVALRRGLPRPTATARLGLLLPVVLVLAEGFGTISHPRVPPAPAGLATVTAPYLVLPSQDLTDRQVMLWSTNRFADVVNGGGDLVPVEIAETRRQVALFPDAASVDYLRTIGIRTVVVLTGPAAGTPWASAATAPIDDLPIAREVTDGTVTFHLEP
jgi:hypothetical protein